MKQYELYYQVAAMKYRESYQRNRDFDAKASSVLGFSVALSGVAAIVLKPFSSSQSFTFGGDTIGAIVVFAVFFALTFSSAMATLRLRDWRAQPDVVQMSQLIDDQSRERWEFEKWAGDAFRDADAENRKSLISKERWLTFSFVFLALLGVSLGYLSYCVYA